MENATSTSKQEKSGKPSKVGKTKGVGSRQWVGWDKKNIEGEPHSKLINKLLENLKEWYHGMKARKARGRSKLEEKIIYNKSWRKHRRGV